MAAFGSVGRRRGGIPRPTCSVDGDSRETTCAATRSWIALNHTTNGALHLCETADGCNVHFRFSINLTIAACCRPWLSRQPGGYTPAEITAAYGLNAITFKSSAGTTVNGNGAGETIALIEEYHDPNIRSDLEHL